MKTNNTAVKNDQPLKNLEGGEIFALLQLLSAAGFVEKSAKKILRLKGGTVLRESIHSLNDSLANVCEDIHPLSTTDGEKEVMLNNNETFLRSVEYGREWLSRWRDAFGGFEEGESIILSARLVKLDRTDRREDIVRGIVEKVITCGFPFAVTRDIASGLKSALDIPSSWKNSCYIILIPGSLKAAGEGASITGMYYDRSEPAQCWRFTDFLAPNGWDFDFGDQIPTILELLSSN